MAKVNFECAECGEEYSITTKNPKAISACPFCGDSLMMSDERDEMRDEDDDSDDDELSEFDPDND